MPNLDEIAQLAAELRDHAAFVSSQNEGEIGSELAEALTMSEAALENKVGACIFVMRELDAEAEQNKSMAAHYASVASTKAKQSERLFKWIELCLSKANIQQIKTPAGSAHFQLNSSASVVIGEDYIQNPEKIPERFIKRSIDIDKKGIAAALKAGEVLEFAKMGERGSSLRIK